MNTLVFLTCLITLSFVKCNKDEFLLVTVATEANDGYNRFLQSTQDLEVPLKTLGMGEPWTGGKIDTQPGGGQKVVLFREAMEELGKNPNLIVMFTDSYDVIVLGNPEEIVKKFKKFEKKIVFGAEGFCWPDQSLESQYPNVTEPEKRFLNSGGFIGYAPQIRDLLNYSPIADRDDDQLFYTKAFLDSKIQEKLGGIALDTKSEIFQNLNGALDEISVRYNDDFGYIYNTKLDSFPLVIHGNGPSKVSLNTLANYITRSWSPNLGCQHCNADTISLDEMNEKDYPLVLMSIFIFESTPFIEEFFEKISNLSYPKGRIELSIYCGVDFHVPEAKIFRNTYLTVYNKTYFYGPLDFASQSDAHNAALTLCLARQCDFWFSVESIVHLDSHTTLNKLVAQNRSILSPMITQVNSLWSTFWGALDANGYYARSDDYMEIVQRTKRGIWNVPLVRNVYLVQRRALSTLDSAFTTGYYKDVEMDFGARARQKNVFMFVDNQDYYGHLIKTDEFPTEHLHNDLWTIFSNPTDWAARYVHPNYSSSLNPDVSVNDLPQPCPDVFWLPLLSERFCKELIEEMEYFGQWSDGKNSDPRLEGGYENVPTRDIHMRQVDWERHWIHFQQTYVYPLQKKVFAGYEDLPSARMNFVVRYRPDEQPILRPHHDASSYTLNIALNAPGVDYEGGGARFVRYNCSIIDSKVGWVLMHPGRVTHIHEGLRTTKGTRYIFVTFINP